MGSALMLFAIEVPKSMTNNRQRIGTRCSFHLLPEIASQLTALDSMKISKFGSCSNSKSSSKQR